jgi:homoserine kinase
MAQSTGRLSVLAPATSANLGPGFDALGLALELRNRVTASLAERTDVLVRGEGEERLSGGRNNLVYRAVGRVYARLGKEPPPLRLECDNRIPLARGLGSSAAAAAAGLVIGNELLGRPFDMPGLVALGAAMEGHADNIAACLLGGIQTCVVLETGDVLHCHVPVPAGLSAVGLIPSFSMSTREARRVLPTVVPLRAAVWNIGRTALLVAALASGRLELLRAATEDAIHQPPRTVLFPALPRILAAALDAGAHGAFMSGAGSTVLALVSGRDEDVATAMLHAARQAGVGARCLSLRISERGAYVE